MDDLQNKVSALQDIFSLFDRDTIMEVLKQNKYSFESTAAVLSEMEPPKKQQFPPLPSLPQQPPQVQPVQQHPQRPVYQPNQPQPAAPAPVVQKATPQTIAKEVKDLMGGVNFDVNQSTIFDVYQATGGKIQDTVQMLKNLNAPDPALEEQKRALERMERERAELYRLEQSKKADRERLEREMEKERQHREMLEEQRRKQNSAEEKQRQQLQQEKMMMERLEREKREYELIKQKLQDEERLKIEKTRLEQEGKERMLREKAERERMERDHMERLERELALRRDEEERRKKELAATKKIELELNQERLRKEAVEVELRKKHDAEMMVLREKERLEQELQVLQREKEICSRELEERLLNEQMARLQVEAELKSKQEQAIREMEAKELVYKQQLEQIQRLKEEEEARRLSDKERLQHLELELQREREDREKASTNSTISLHLVVEPPNSIIVTFNLANQVHSSCWIGIYPTHQPKHDRYLTYQSISGNEGTAHFTNIIPGHYEARLFTNKYDLLLKSSSVKIGPDVKISAHVLGDEIHVKYTVSPPSAMPTSDWIGLYTKDTRNKKYIDNTYGNAMGSAIFKSPRVPGEYSVRYFCYPTKYNEQAIAVFDIVDMDRVEVLTPIVSKGDEIKVDYSVNTVVPSSSDWIGLYAIGEENNKSYLHSQYTDGTGSGIITFTAPDRPGNYEVRFFSYSKGRYNTFKVSNKFVITP